MDRIAKQIPFEIGMTLTKALEESEELKASYENEEEVTAILDMALTLEGVGTKCRKTCRGRGHLADGTDRLQSAVL